MTQRCVYVDVTVSSPLNGNQPNKIIAHTAQARGLGDIIIATASGGIGSCTVQFEGYVVHTGDLEHESFINSN